MFIQKVDEESPYSIVEDSDEEVGWHVNIRPLGCYIVQSVEEYDS